MLSARIAARYLLSKKSHGAVNVISAISVAGVAVATAAIVVVLSVFNGFTRLAETHLSVVDPDLLAAPLRGKVFGDADRMAAELARLPEVAAAVPSLTERGLMVCGERQLPVVFKGVTPDHYKIVDMERLMTVGGFAGDSTGIGDAPAQLAVGVAARLDIRPGLSRPELYVPRRVGRINPANPAGAFFSVPLAVTGIMQVEQMDFDADHIFIPLVDARRILQYAGGEASALEIALADGVDADEGRRAVERALGADFSVADRTAQHAGSMRMIAIEKWVTFIMLGFILVIAAFNILSTLSLMVIEKRDNMATLRCLGARRTVVRGIFMWQAAIITLGGGVIGMSLGIGLSLAQEYGRFITLGGDASKMTIDVYPVSVEAGDIAAVAGILLAVAAMTALCTRFFTRRL